MEKSPKVLLVLALLAAAPALPAEVVRTLKVELPASASVKVENLAGTLTAVPGSGAGIVITATVHAESDRLADQFALSRPDGASAAAILVRYPDIGSIRYPDPRSDDGWSIEIFSGNRVEYDGRRYRVSHHHGDLAWADVRVEAPAGTRVELGQITGLVRVSDLKSGVAVKVHDADIDLRHVEGGVELAGTSGDTKATQISGKWRSTFTSGDLSLDRFQGGPIDIRTTSGDVAVDDITATSLSIAATSGDVGGRNVRADSLDFDATSGNFVLSEIVAGRFEGRATSGDISASGTVRDAARIRTSSGNVDMDLLSAPPGENLVHTSSGDVHLRLPRSAEFDIESHRRSGDLDVDVDDLTTDRRDEHEAHFRKGSGGARFELETGSGDQYIQAR